MQIIANTMKIFIKLQIIVNTMKIFIKLQIIVNTMELMAPPLQTDPLSLLSDIGHFFAGSPLLPPIKKRNQLISEKNDKIYLRKLRN